jgi:predicted ATPase/transcriptional regulator with XRE-family HTH domain/Tfp pilus assembly protein PilF
MFETNNLPFHVWLRQRRKTLDMTQEALAECVGCSKGAIQKIETKERRPSRQIAQRLAVCLYVPPEEEGALVRFARSSAVLSEQILPGGSPYNTDPVVGELTMSTDRVPGLTPVGTTILPLADASLLSPVASSPMPINGAPNSPIIRSKHSIYEPAEWLEVWRAIRTSPTNLTLPSTSFVGRKIELTQIHALLRDDGVRLLNLVGAPGVGKTRLAQQAAVGMLNDFADGIFFVDLAPVREPGRVLSAIAQALNLSNTAALKTPLLESVQQHLRGKCLLLVLDNYEHLTQAGYLATTLLGAASRLKVLVTSRQVLHLPGEYLFEVQPLQVPEAIGYGLPGSGPYLESESGVEEQSISKSAASFERLARSEAVQLFLQRAGAINPDFVLNDRNARAVAEICHRLDGLPLAIELAAARVRLLTPGAILLRLDRRLPLLRARERQGEETGEKTAHARHRTLRQAIEWSYQLLGQHEKPLFRCAGVFVGGCGLDAIGAVCNPNGDPEGATDVLDGVEELVCHSLLQHLTQSHLLPAVAQEGGEEGEPRFAMLETVREYAQEQLEASGEATATRGRHARYFLAVAEEAERGLKGQDQVFWLRRMEQEHANLQSAVQWTQEAGEDEMSLRLVGALCWFWQAHGHYTVGRELLAGVLSNPRTREYPVARQKACDGAGRLAFNQGDYEAAQTLVTEGLAIAREQKDMVGVANSLNTLGHIALNQGDYTVAQALYEEVSQIRRSLGDPRGIASSLNNLGQVARNQGDYMVAQGYLEESIVLYRQLGDKRSIAGALNNLGQVARDRGDNDLALKLYTESLDIRKDLGDRQGVAVSFNNLGQVMRACGNYDSARTLFRESIAMKEELGVKDSLAWSLYNLGAVEYALRDYEQAQRLLRKSLGIRRDLGGDKHGSALCLLRLAEIDVAQGRIEQAARLFGQAEAILEATGGIIERDDLPDYKRSVREVRDRLGEEAWQAAHEQGRAMSIEEATSYALESGTQHFP